MTISDVLLVLVSAIVIGGLYLVGRYSRKVHEDHAPEKKKKR